MKKQKAKNKKHLLKLIDKGIAKFGFGADLNYIDTSSVKDMSLLFYNSHFNGNISKWDVSNVKDMEAMFFLAVGFNQPIGDWNVGKVQYMDEMFYRAETFNQPIGNWDTSGVIGMENMFVKAKSFKQDISKWNIKKVEYLNSMGMFYHCPILKKNRPKFKKENTLEHHLERGVPFNHVSPIISES